jgi:TatD DNase family protein
LIPGASPKDLPTAVSLSEKYKEVFFAVGVHPYDIEDFNIDILKNYASHPKCVAVGECGLDYYRLPDDEDKKMANIQLQKEVFISHINFAKKIKKPLIVHIRDASNDSKVILEDNYAGDVGGVLHCFNASEHLLSLSEHNFYFGVGGVVTFKNAKKLIEVLPKIPKDKLLIETDAPYLTPHPFRGIRNEPKYTKYVVDKVANILGLTSSEIENITTENTNNLFKEFASIN